MTMNHDFDWQIDEFMLCCRTNQLRPKTMKSYEQTLHLFQRWCQENYDITEPQQVTESLIRRYVNDLQERGKYSFYAVEQSKESNYPERRRDFRQPISPVTINNYLRNLRVFFNWMEQEEMIRKNPMKKIRLLKTERSAKEYLSDEELHRLFSHLDRSYYAEHRDYTMILLMLDSGMRLGECSTLQISDLDLSRHRISLQASKTKNGKARTVFFSPKTEAALRRWIAFKDRYVESDYLFPVQSHGSPIAVGNFETNFKKYILSSGLNPNYTPHCLRNNFAKRCLMNGMDIYTLSRILGHSSVKVTEAAYLDLNTDDIGRRYQHCSPMGTL